MCVCKCNTYACMYIILNIIALVIIVAVLDWSTGFCAVVIKPKPT